MSRKHVASTLESIKTHASYILTALIIALMGLMTAGCASSDFSKLVDENVKDNRLIHVRYVDLPTGERVLCVIGWGYESGISCDWSSAVSIEGKEGIK